MRLYVNGNKDTFWRHLFFLSMLASHYGTIDASLIKLVSVGSGLVYVPDGAIL